jgi:hypothetical protein
MYTKDNLPDDKGLEPNRKLDQNDKQLCRF